MVKKLFFIIISMLLVVHLGLNVSVSAEEKEKKDESKKKTPTKVVYLTFDDGPNQYTSKILDTLKKKKAPATFFMIEPNIKRYPKTANRIIKEGHYPGLHSVSHNATKLYKGNSVNVAVEMEKTRVTLKKVTNFNSHLTRVPYGSKPYMTKPFRDHLVKKGFKMWDWNIDTLDWKYKYTNPNMIVSNVKSGLKGKKGPVIILFHDSKGTASTLPKIIDYIRKQGYTIVPYDPKHHVNMNYWKDKRL